MQEKQKVGRDYGWKRWMVYPLKSYFKLFSTSSFPVCNQRKKLLTNSQRKILTINLYTDKQDRSQQGLWEIIPAKCLHWGKTKSSRGSHELWSNPEQPVSSVLPVTSDVPMPLPGHEPSLWYLLQHHKTSPEYSYICVIHRWCPYIPKDSCLLQQQVISYNMVWFCSHKLLSDVSLASPTSV